MTIYAVNGKEPIAAWIPSLDTAGNGTTTLNDLIGSNDGTLTNMDSSTDWVSDTAAGGVRALDFDGSNDYVALADSWSNSIGTGDLAISCYVYVRSLGTRQMILAKDAISGRSFGLSINESNGNYSSGCIHIATIPNGSDYFLKFTGSVLVANSWNHICVSKQSGVWTLWHNGSSVSSSTGSSTASENSAIQSTGSSLRIGAREYSGAEDYFNGRIDDLRVFNVALDSSDVSYLYNSGNGRGRTTSAGVTGSLAATLGSVTASSSGTVAAGLSGSLSSTLANVAVSSSGTITDGATGSVTATLGNLSATSDGTLANGLTGSLSTTLGNVTLSASGAEASSPNGSVSSTLGQLTCTAAGTVANGLIGSVGSTLGNLSLASGGSLSDGLAAQVNKALESCVVSSTGTVANGTTAALSVQLASVSLTARGGETLPGGFKLNVAGDWKDATLFVKVGGSWKTATPFIKVGGAWK